MQNVWRNKGDRSRETHQPFARRLHERDLHKHRSYITVRQRKRRKIKDHGSKQEGSELARSKQQERASDLGCGERGGQLEVVLDYPNQLSDKTSDEKCECFVKQNQASKTSQCTVLAQAD